MGKTLSYILLLLALVSCGTGIESTTAVSEKQARKELAQYKGPKAVPSLRLEPDSVAHWKAGKQFYVTDDQVRLIFTHSDAYNPDTLHLGGHVLSYAGYDTGSVLDNRHDVTLKFSDGAHTYGIATGKTLAELHSDYTLPFMIDMDVVRQVSSQLAGHDYYIKTRIWYNPATEEMIDGRQFIKVHIDSVLPGNKVLPLKVMFTASDNRERAMLWLSTGASAMHSRDFDSMFARQDLHLSYPNISDENWQRIVHGQIALEMTKEECRLAMGNPSSINQLPDQTGLKEYWYYDGGRFLYFQDGILKKFRK